MMKNNKTAPPRAAAIALARTDGDHGSGDDGENMAPVVAPGKQQPAVNLFFKEHVLDASQSFSSDDESDLVFAGAGGGGGGGAAAIGRPSAGLGPTSRLSILSEQSIIDHENENDDGDLSWESCRSAPGTAQKSATTMMATRKNALSSMNRDEEADGVDEEEDVHFPSDAKKNQYVDDAPIPILPMRK